MSAHPRTGVCAICKHPDRSRIEALRLSGVSLRIVAKRFGLTGKDAVHYHFKRHVTPERRASLMLGAAKLEELVNQATKESRSLLERMNVATSILFSRFIACAEAGDDNALANIAGRLNTLFRDYAHLTGELRGLRSRSTRRSTSSRRLDSSRFRAAYWPSWGNILMRAQTLSASCAT
jgi:hypothetical protein